MPEYVQELEHHDDPLDERDTRLQKMVKSSPDTFPCSKDSNRSGSSVIVFMIFTFFVINEKKASKDP